MLSPGMMSSAASSQASTTFDDTGAWLDATTVHTTLTVPSLEDNTTNEEHQDTEDQDDNQIRLSSDTFSAPDFDLLQTLVKSPLDSSIEPVRRHSGYELGEIPASSGVTRVDAIQASTTANSSFSGTLDEAQHPGKDVSIPACQSRRHQNAMHRVASHSPSPLGDLHKRTTPVRLNHIHEVKPASVRPIKHVGFTLFPKVHVERSLPQTNQTLPAKGTIDDRDCRSPLDTNGIPHHYSPAPSQSHHGIAFKASQSQSSAPRQYLTPSASSQKAASLSKLAAKPSGSQFPRFSIPSSAHPGQLEKTRTLERYFDKLGSSSPHAHLYAGKRSTSTPHHASGCKAEPSATLEAQAQALHTTIPKLQFVFTRMSATHKLYADFPDHTIIPAITTALEDLEQHWRIRRISNLVNCYPALKSSLRRVINQGIKALAELVDERLAKQDMDAKRNLKLAIEGVKFRLGELSEIEEKETNQQDQKAYCGIQSDHRSLWSGQNSATAVASIQKDAKVATDKITMTSLQPAIELAVSSEPDDRLATFIAKVSGQWGYFADRPLHWLRENCRTLEDMAFSQDWNLSDAFENERFKLMIMRILLEVERLSNELSEGHWMRLVSTSHERAEMETLLDNVRWAVRTIRDRAGLFPRTVPALGM